MKGRRGSTGGGGKGGMWRDIRRRGYYFELST